MGQQPLVHINSREALPVLPQEGLTIAPHFSLVTRAAPQTLWSCFWLSVSVLSLQSLVLLTLLKSLCLAIILRTTVIRSAG